MVVPDTRLVTADWRAATVETVTTLPVGGGNGGAGGGAMRTAAAKRGAQRRSRPASPSRRRNIPRSYKDLRPGAVTRLTPGTLAPPPDSPLGFTSPLGNGSFCVRRAQRRARVEERSEVMRPLAILAGVLLAGGAVSSLAQDAPRGRRPVPLRGRARRRAGRHAGGHAAGARFAWGGARAGMGHRAARGAGRRGRRRPRGGRLRGRRPGAAAPRPGRATACAG